MSEMKNFSSSDVSQESQYAVPYHYIPAFEDGHFSQHLSWSWGLHYMGALEYILEIIGEEPFDSLIDVGCGDGRLLREISRRFSQQELLGVDYSQRAIDFAAVMNPELNYRCADICSDKLPLQSFDIVTLVEVLEHIPVKSVSNFVNAFARLNKPGGRLLLTVPHKNKGLQVKHFQHFDSITLRRILEPHYEIEKIVFIDKLSRITGRILHPLLENRFFILNNRPLLDLMFRIYRRHLFFCDEKTCGRLFVSGRKK